MEIAVYISITTVFLLTIVGALSNKAFLTLTIEPEDTVFNIDSNRESAIFHCKADGHPTPEITWLANDEIITETSLYNVTEEGSLLISAPPRHLNGSSYRCIANNSFGAVMSKAATLEIAYVDPFPDGSPPPEYVNAKLGICITCNPPNAYPGIKTIWKETTVNGDTEVTSDDRIRLMRDGRLCFAHTQSTDTHFYHCIVSNRYRDDGVTNYTSSPFTFTVLTAGTLPGQSLKQVPDIQEHVTVKQGQEAVLECFFFGRPTPILEWSRPGNGLLSNSIQHRNNQELRILNAQPQDSGEYQCTGISDGDSETVSRYLTVLAPPNLVSGLEDEEVDPGSTVTLQCTADSDAVEYSWYYNTRLINGSSQRPRITKDNTLTIHNFTVKDSGIYQCAARNVHGMTLSTAQLSAKEQVPTNAPTNKKTFESEIESPESEPPGNGASDTLVLNFSLVAIVSAVLLEVIPTTV